MSADTIVKSFIDRVLRLKEEQDALAADIREVYAEAKGNGYDKTAMGAVVAHLRKIEKHGADALEERDAAFGLYLDAYERASSHTPAPARVREIIEEFDAETGEITEHEQPSSQDADVVNPQSRAKPVPAESLGDEISAPITNPQPSTLSGADKPEAVRPPPVSGALSDDDVPAFLKRDHAPKPAGDKPNCLKLKDGHCRIGFATSALCADCNAARSKARAGA